ncbi:FAD binding domain-containing protein [Alkalicoccus daliensis]|uniref:Carbon-monoxide dehydrogenase medium subunit n=1 Tax=Alkalicoccus daliensis TaxID=745820 RepID=A0A1H0ETF3_9BACI|nr:FAD binding domain-containing protein [Alkalicoccus daliensis]SDN85630.1 carbon-monoxide dehydrogenase medium subunit [Alkalicoccus daliensis]
MIKTKHVWKPATVPEAWMLSNKFKEECCFVAGGTWLRTQWEAAVAEEPPQLISLDEIAELKTGIELRENEVVISSLARLSLLMKNVTVRKELPLLAQACARIAAPSVRNQATLGGNILTKLGDTLPVLLIYEAKLCWYDGLGYCTEPLDEWLESRNKETRILVQIKIPLLITMHDTLQFYMKTGRRETFIPSQVTVSGYVGMNSSGDVTEARIAAGGGNAVSKRLKETEQLFLEASTRSLFPAMIHQKIKSEFQPPDDVFASSTYKKRAAANLIVSQWFKRTGTRIAADET